MIHIIVDSCCDLTPDMRESMDISVAPLKVILADGHEYLDDGQADTAAMLAEIAASRHGAGSSCPSTEDFAQHMRRHDASFVVTLSSKLSGSYNAARLAADMVREESPDKKIYIFDSKSASAGEVQIALFLHDHIQQGLSFEEIIPLAEDFIAHMHTMFVVEDLGNLIRNGRLGKVSGLIASVLSLCPIMGENGQGEIVLVSKVRGVQNSLRKLVEQIADMTADTASQTMRLVLCHCHCAERANELRRNLLEQCQALRDVVVVSTGALSSVYANKGGVVVAFSH